MSSSVFDNKSFVPDDTLLQEALGKTNETWEDIKQFIIANYPGYPSRHQILNRRQALAIAKFTAFTIFRCFAKI
jgi:hypothetical protein